MLALLCLPLPAQTVKELFQKVRSSVVVIKTEEVEVSPETDFRPVSLESIGSGVLIDEKRVLTAAHVVQAATTVVVQFVDGSEVRARIVASSVPEDIALLELEKPQPRMTPASLGDSQSIDVGDPVVIVGAPYGLSYSLTTGFISGRHLPRKVASDLSQAEYLQTDATVNQGNSGGPMFDMQGRVVGIVSSILTSSGGYEGIGFAVPINTARRLLWDKRTFWFGADGIILSPRIAGLLNVAEEDAILVQQVVPNSPAARAGLRPSTVAATLNDEPFKLGGDVILSIGGHKTSDPEFLQKVKHDLATLNGNERVEVMVLRDGKVQKLWLTR
jgi:S1-C subfamily serine protease